MNYDPAGYSSCFASTAEVTDESVEIIDGRSEIGYRDSYPDFSSEDFLVEDNGAAEELNSRIGKELGLRADGSRLIGEVRMKYLPQGYLFIGNGRRLALTKDESDVFHLRGHVRGEQVSRILGKAKTFKRKGIKDLVHMLRL